MAQPRGSPILSWLSSILHREPKTKSLNLEPKNFLYVFSFLSRSEIRGISLAYMRRLNEDVDEIVNFAVLISDQEVAYVERIDKTSGFKLTANLRVGSRRPVHANAIGKVILTFLSEADQRRILDHLYSPEYHDKTYCSKSTFLSELQDIRRLGIPLIRVNCS
jgi:DNA-binding IclR family transcriptional regulator